MDFFDPVKAVWIFFQNENGSLSYHGHCWSLVHECITPTDPTLSCPRSLLKTTSTLLGYQWVSWGRYVTLESVFRGLVLDHQLLKAPEPKNRSKRAKFDQKQQFLGGFLALAPLNLDGRAPNH